MERESDYPNDDYEAHQTAQDAAYALEYCRWVETLTDAEKDRLTLGGAQEPDTSRRAPGGGHGEIEASLVGGRLGRENDERVPTIEAPEPTDSDSDQLREMGLTDEQVEGVLQWVESKKSTDSAVINEAATMLAKILALITPPTKKINLSRVGVATLALRYLTNREGTTTLTELAQRAGLSKQLFDHHVRVVEEKLGFHGFAQKGIQTRARYSEAARQRWAALTPEERRARRAGKKSVENLTTCDD